MSAAGVKTLDIVPAPSTLAGSAGGTNEALPHEGRATPADAPAEAEVDVAPVSPKVREVRVAGLRSASPRTAREQSPAAPPRSKARQAKPRTKTLVALSDVEDVHGYATVGATWSRGASYSEDQISIAVRTATRGQWSGWIPVSYNPEEGPDGTTESGEPTRPGTDPLIIGDVDKVQLRAETTDGTTPPDLKLAVIDPGTGETARQEPAIDTAKLDAARTADSTAPADGEDAATLSAMKVAPKPYIYSRAQWGANEKMRDQSNPAYGTIKTGFIHHTVNANNYTADQVPSLLRGIYAYHTQSKGWRDIGYNFLVDRFGRIWEGRWGGVDRPVVGAHTLGYNEVSFAMSAIGNFDTAQPPQAVSDAYARLFAWKLSMYDIRADASRLWVKNRYLQAINGHRDTGSTACPGRYLYAKIPAIRVATQATQNKAQTGTPPPPPPPPPPFTSPSQTPQPATDQPAGIAFPGALNLTGSGHPDLVLKDKDGVVSVLPTGGQTGFARGVATPGRWWRMSLIAGVGDITGDGRGDVIARLRKDGKTRVYAGVGYGKVRTTGDRATRQFRWANSVIAAGDWNRDRRNDVLMRNRSNGYLWMVPGTGTGRWGTKVLLATGWSGFTSVAVAGDLDRNGTQDIVALNRNGYLYVVPSTTKGTLGTPRAVQHVGTSITNVVGTGDMSGDGIGDVAVRASNGTFGIMTGDGKGGFGPTLGWFRGLNGLRQLTGAQMSGTGQSDLVGTNSTGTQLITSLNNGLTNVRPVPASNLTVPAATMLLNVGDWNRDGKGDVVTREAGGDTLILRPGLGNGQFGAGVEMSDGWKSFANIVAVGDVNGDKLPDLVARTASGPMTVFPGNGRTGFLAPELAPANLRTFNQIGDGSWSPGGMPHSSFYGPGGSFVPFSGSTGGWMGKYNWVVGPGDVDGDRVADLVVRDAGGTVWLLPGTASGYGEPRYLADGFEDYTFLG